MIFQKQMLLMQLNALEPGDKGVDALYVSPADDGLPLAIVIPGKYGAVGTNVDVYGETQKFFSALKVAYTGASVTSAIDKIAAVLKNGGLVRYVIATIEPLEQKQKEDLENTKKIANYDFGDRLVFEAMNLKKMYNVYMSQGPVEARVVDKQELIW